MTEKQYREWEPKQQHLLPPSLEDWLPDDHPVYVLLEVVEELDLSAIEKKYQNKDPRGTRPYPPQMMTALLLYGYSTGVYSSRKLEKATYEDIPFRLLTDDLHPDHSRIAEFRRVHLDELKDIFVQVLQICDRMGLVEMGDIALDGTKIQASASKHKAMSYERMLEQEERLEEEIEELLDEAERTDQKEDEAFGRDRRGDELPEELQRREDRLESIREAKEQLEEEAREARAKELEEQAEGHEETAETHDDEAVRKRSETLADKKRQAADEMSAGEETESFETTEGMPKHRPKRETDGTPTSEAQRNFTDPDSRIMTKNGTYLQGYNGQAAVDADHQIIVGYGLTNQASDAGNLVPMLDQVFAQMGELPAGMLADSGYWNGDVVSQLEEREIDALIATGREKTDRSVSSAEEESTESGDDQGSADSKAPSGEEASSESPDGGESTDAQAPSAEEESSEPADDREKMAEKLRTEEGRERYAKRKVIVEPVFGQMKEARGFRRFHLRGLEKARAEWSLVCTGHNLQKLYGALGAQTGAVGPDGGW